VGEVEGIPQAGEEAAVVPVQMRDIAQSLSHGGRTHNLACSLRKVPSPLGGLGNGGERDKLGTMSPAGSAAGGRGLD
jgi:hypothetical protein